VHDLLLQKHDGTFELVVWGERLKGSDEMAVRFGEPASIARLYDPTRGTTPIQSLRGIDPLTLTLSDHPVIIEIPAGTGESRP
jgi:hypothetical protein